MQEFKVNDKVTIGPNSVGVDGGTVFTVVDNLRVKGVWIDVRDKEVMLKYVHKGSQNCFADFTLYLEDKPKRFQVGDRVISIKNTPSVPEGYVGFVVENDQSNYEYAVKDNNGHTEYFNEDELELLSAKYPHNEIGTPDIARPILEERKIGKVQMNLFDEGFPNAVMEVAKVMTWAAENKGYKPHDWVNLPDAESSFPSAASRHRVKSLIQKVSGLPVNECVDEESGILHKAHEAFNVLAELELMLRGKIK